jgi:hypothetical protein
MNGTLRNGRAGAVMKPNLDVVAGRFLDGNPVARFVPLKAV